MRVGVLQADCVDAEHRDRFGDYPTMFANTLGDAARDLSFAFFNVRAGRYPRRIEDCDGYIVTGSRHSVYDDMAWIADLADFARQLHRARARTVGICFGHQLIAHALGGVVGPAAVGWGVGVHAWNVVARPAWMRPPRRQFRLLASHRDQVEALPPDARLLATSAFCPRAAFALSDHVLALQGHPEFSKPYAEHLMRRRRVALGDAFEPGMRSLAQATDERAVAGWIVNFLRGVVPDSVR